MKPEETMLIIPESVVREMGKYLSTRPWIEVQHFMPELQSLQVVSISEVHPPIESAAAEPEELA
jgi:hypothetical protein